MQRPDSFQKTWCWEILKPGGEADDRGWDGWMASLTQCTWVWVSSGSWWWTGKPGVLQSMVLQRVRDNWETELIWIELGSLCCYLREAKSVLRHNCCYWNQQVHVPDTEWDPCKLNSRVWNRERFITDAYVEQGGSCPKNPKFQQVPLKANVRVGCS